jgi:hypothetical protein
VHARWVVGWRLQSVGCTCLETHNTRPTLRPITPPPTHHPPNLKPPGNESHAGQVFTCVGALALADSLDRCDADLVSWWLAERQTRSGGLNGRPEKLQDVCYSWWCLSCLAILGRLEWIDRGALTRFILDCQVGREGVCVWWRVGGSMRRRPPATTL